MLPVRYCPAPLYLENPLCTLTDGVGSQLKCCKAIPRWCMFHDNLPDENPNRISTKNDEIALLSNLYGRPKDLRDAIADDVMRSDDSFQLILGTL